MLELDRIQVSYGAAPALWDVSLRIGPGELVCVVGPNGAGKTTLINAIAGLNRVASGALRMDGRDLTSLPRNRFCDQGIAIVPEGRRLFTGMTVAENLELGSYRPAARAERAQSLERVLSVFPALGERLRALAGTLSGGQQQMVAIGRALMAKPRLLLLDEPSLGLAPLIVREIFSIISSLRATGVSILLVEQNARAALQVSDYGYVLETGDLVLEGRSADLAANPRVAATYLGKGATATTATN